MYVIPASLLSNWWLQLGINCCKQ